MPATSVPCPYPSSGLVAFGFSAARAITRELASACETRKSGDASLMPVSMTATPTPLPVLAGHTSGVCADWLNAVANLLASNVTADGFTAPLRETTVTAASARSAATCAAVSSAPTALISRTSRVTVPPTCSTTTRRAPAEDTSPGANCTMYSPLTGAAWAAGAAAATRAASSVSNAAPRLWGNPINLRVSSTHGMHSHPCEAMPYPSDARRRALSRLNVYAGAEALRPAGSHRPPVQPPSLLDQ